MSTGSVDLLFFLFGGEEKMDVPHSLVISISSSGRRLDKFCATDLFRCLLEVGDMTFDSNVVIRFFVLDVGEAATAAMASTPSFFILDVGDAATA